MVQQDAFQFTQMLMDKHEAGFSNDVIQDLIRGNTVDVIEAHSQEYQQERLPIAGSDNMAQPLRNSYSKTS